MSFISAFKTFGSEFESIFQKLFKKAPAFEAGAISFISVAAPEVEAAFALYDPALAVVAKPIIDKIESALAVTQLTLKNAGPAPTVISLLQSIQANAQQLMQVGQVKDSATQEKITGTLDALVAGIQGVIATIQATTPTATPAAPTTAVAK
jgi:hypothetical protein